MPALLTALDVHYYPSHTVTGCVIFRDWTDAEPLHRESFELPGGAVAYEPGQFYKRELPVLLEVLDRLRPFEIGTVVIDGYVTLAGARSRGLGHHLYEALGETVAVIGVAKNRFRNSGSNMREVLRGQSTRPLYVTAAGMDLEAATEAVRNMHGPYRQPTLLKEADRLSRRDA